MTEGAESRSPQGWLSASQGAWPMKGGVCGCPEHPFAARSTEAF